jgi:serine/threonine protein kinase
MLATSIGKYVIDREIGKGAFGVVYEGHLQSDPSQKVAVKLLDKSGNVERQLAEPELLSRLQHPNIVRLRDYFIQDQQLAIVLDFIPGGDLKSALENGRCFSDTEVRELLRSMASALSIAHRQNIVHRDIKLANIMLDDSGPNLRFILTDFGIGRIEDGVQDRPNTGGTMLFMAPEQFRGRPSAQSDLWALGVVAYRLLSGKMPFQGQSLQELSRSILYVNPLAPSTAAGKAGDEKLDLIVMQLLQKSLNERVSSADDLERLMTGPGKQSLVSASRIWQTGGSLILESGGSLLQALGQGESAAKNRTTGMDALIRRLKLQQAFAIAGAACFVLLIAWGAGFFRGSMKLLGLSLFYLSQTNKTRYATSCLIAAGLVLLLSFVDSSGISSSKQQDPSSSADVGEQLASQVEFAVDTVGPDGKSSLEDRIEEAVEKSLEEPTSNQLNVRVDKTSKIQGYLDVLSRISYPLLALAIAAHRRLTRQIFNCALLTQDTTSESTLESMRLSIAERPNDVLFRLKYVEALLAAGRLEDVIVECQLVLEIDPYHFNTNLMLANAMLELGLLEQAAKVCQSYLSISGYCFEFQVVIERCRNLGAAT